MPVFPRILAEKFMENGNFAPLKPQPSKGREMMGVMFGVKHLLMLDHDL